MTNGNPSPLGSNDFSHQPALPQARQWSPPLSLDDDATHLLHATVIQHERPAMEDAFYNIPAMQLFAGPSLDGAIPDHTTIMNFRHLLERHGLARTIFKEVSDWLSEAGVLVKEGTLMDAIHYRSAQLNQE